MSLETSYEVLEMLRDDGVQTFRAREKATGRGLELHLFLPFGRPENKTLFDKLKALPLEARKNFLDLGLDGSTPYVVTDPLPDGCGFKTWADQLMSGSRPVPAAFSVPPAPNGPSRDDGVKILQAGQWRTGTPIPDSLFSKPPAPPPPVAPPPVPQRQDAGDLTSVFIAPTFPLPAPPQETVKTATMKPNEFQASEFTRMFQTQEPVTAAPERPSANIGEFTGLFAAKQASPAPPPPLPPAAPPPPQATPAPPPEAMGEFTRMFQTPPEVAPAVPLAVSKPLPPVAPPPPPRVSAPVQPPPPVFQPAPPAPSPFSRQPDPADGGEFTKFFESPLKPGPMNTPPPMMDSPAMAPPPPPAAKRSGDFTGVFGRPSGPSPSGSPGGFSFDAPSPSPPPPSTPAFGANPSATGAFSAQPSWSQPQAQPSFAPGPSEYTKMMGAPAISSAPAPSLFTPATNAPPAAPPAPAKSNMLIYLIIGIVVLIAISIAVAMFGPHATPPAAK